MNPADKANVMPADRPWATYHRDFRGVIDGVRYIMAIDPKTGGSILRPWRDPRKAVKASEVAS